MLDSAQTQLVVMGYQLSYVGETQEQSASYERPYLEIGEHSSLLEQTLSYEEDNHVKYQEAVEEDNG